jgi:hypothetical protein
MQYPVTLRRDVVVLAILIVVHEGMKRALANGALVAALFSPGGAHSSLTLGLGLLLLVCRLGLLVAAPGWAVATGFDLLSRNLRVQRPR